MKLYKNVQLAILAMAYMANEEVLTDEQMITLAALQLRLQRSDYIKEYDTDEEALGELAGIFDLALATIDQALTEEGL